MANAQESRETEQWNYFYGYYIMIINLMSIGLEWNQVIVLDKVKVFYAIYIVFSTTIKSTCLLYIAAVKNYPWSYLCKCNQLIKIQAALLFCPAHKPQEVYLTHRSVVKKGVTGYYGGWNLDLELENWTINNYQSPLL